MPNAVCRKGILDGMISAALDALAKPLEPDSEGNRVKDAIGINTANSIIYGKDSAICTIDIDNLIVVGTKDEVLVCPDKSQRLKFCG